MPSLAHGIVNFTFIKAARIPLARKRCSNIVIVHFIVANNIYWINTNSLTRGNDGIIDSSMTDFERVHKVMKIYY